MNVQSEPYRVASQSLAMFLTPSTTPPRPWVDLPAETRKQIARRLAPLLVRMRSIRAPTRVDRHVESVE